MSRSTVYAVLRRQGESRMSDGDRSTGLRIRYVRERPRELLHLDVKKLGRIPEGVAMPCSDPRLGTDVAVAGSSCT
jgi:hypothetical protein